MSTYTSTSAPRFDPADPPFGCVSPSFRHEDPYFPDASGFCCNNCGEPSEEGRFCPDCEAMALEDYVPLAPGARIAPSEVRA